MASKFFIDAMFPNYEYFLKACIIFVGVFRFRKNIAN